MGVAGINQLILLASIEENIEVLPDAEGSSPVFAINVFFTMAYSPA